MEPGNHPAARRVEFNAVVCAALSPIGTGHKELGTKLLQMAAHQRVIGADQRLVGADFHLVGAQKRKKVA